jgi:cell division protein FtsB
MPDRTRRPVAGDQERTRRGRLRLGTVLLGALAGVLVIEGLLGDRGLLAMRRAQREHRTVVAALERTRAENDRLRDAIQGLRHDPARLEEAARELGLIRPGETLFIIRDVPQPAK